MHNPVAPYPMFSLDHITEAGFILAVYMSMLFLVALAKKDNSIADIGYGLGFLVVVYAGFLFSGWSISSSSFFSPELLLPILVTIWGGRLSWRIFRKNLGKPEDFRYAKWRTQWRWFRVRSFFQVYMLQGFIIFIIASPILLVQGFSGRAGVDYALLLLGLCMWLIGFYFEAMGDMELDRFLRSPDSKGKLMTTGLWKYTRHPNYFGESLMWWGIFVITLSSGHPLAWFAVVSPMLITFLLLKVSGIPLLEARMSEHPDWEAYARKTNAFFPWRAKHE